MKFNTIDIDFEVSVNSTRDLEIVVIEERKALMLGELIDCVEIKKKNYKIPIILGKDFNGNICV